MSDKKPTFTLAVCAIILFFMFLTLKFAEIGKVKDWNWWWVFSPLWIYAGLVTSLAILIFGWVILKDLLFGEKEDESNPNSIQKRSKFQERLEEMEKQKRK